jgi:hypothetical protein
MIQELERKSYKKNAPNKYHVDCGYYEKNTDNIHITELVRNKNDVSILENITHKQRHIVVKIGKENTTIQKEFHIGKYWKLQKYRGLFDIFVFLIV